eukprot:6821686-Prymnesium_polylepis.1
MFVHTAETVLTLTRSQLIANAITRSGGGGRPIRDRVWMLRSAFDTLLDEIGDGEADLATVVGDGSQAAANVENTRFTNQSAAARTSMTSLTMPKVVPLFLFLRNNTKIRLNQVARAYGGHAAVLCAKSESGTYRTVSGPAKIR